MITDLEEKGFIPLGRAELPGNETIPIERKGYGVVFRDFFTCGLRLPSHPFLRSVLVDFDAQIYHLTPHAFLNLSKFIWVVESYGGQPDIDTFLEHYELQKMPKAFGERKIKAQFGGCTFIAKRRQALERLEISWCQ